MGIKNVLGKAGMVKLREKIKTFWKCTEKRTNFGNSNKSIQKSGMYTGMGRLHFYALAKYLQK